MMMSFFGFGLSDMKIVEKSQRTTIWLLTGQSSWTANFAATALRHGFVQDICLVFLPISRNQKLAII